MLPDAFSPSKNRGVHEYVDGGHADTVRGWILDVATRTGIHESLSMPKTATAKPDGVSLLSRAAQIQCVRRVVLKNVNCGFVIVEAIADGAELESSSLRDDDGESRLWMLIDTYSRPVARLEQENELSKSQLDFLAKGSRFRVREAHASSWELNINLPVLASDSDARKLRSCFVAVLWNII